MIRAAFLQGLGAVTVATGGLDVWGTHATRIRVLVGTLPATSADLAWDAYPDGTFGFAGRRWRGAPSTVRLDDGRLALVTAIGVDDYLRGVVPLEAPPSWPAAALQVQAIVARTYALARRTLSRPYDVVASDADQRWGGVAAETPSTSAAIDATAGLTVRYGGGLASVFYSACCGGHTADVVAAWDGPPLPYLRGVPDPWCAAAPDYRWSTTVGVDRVLDAFGAQVGGALASASLVDIDDSGRPHEVALAGTQTATVPVTSFRRALGYDVIPSTWLRALRIDTTQAAPRLAIEGSGRGHGVGLCQWGARFFASSGASAAEILALYFPGTAVSGG